MIDAGLVGQYSREILRELKANSSVQAIPYEEVALIGKLNMSNLQGVFLLWGSLIAISFIVFSIEHCVTPCQK